jgi:hypothetical protein
LLVGLFLMIDSGLIFFWIVSGFVVRFLFFIGFSMESLILAQDERWRRA